MIDCSNLEVHILLVDDVAVNRRVMRQLLRALGFRGGSVLEACDGVEALELFTQHRHSISAVLMDLHMPRLNGWQTVSKLRELEAGSAAPGMPHTHVPVVACTATDLDELVTGERHSSPSPPSHEHIEALPAVCMYSMDVSISNLLGAPAPPPGPLTSSPPPASRPLPIPVRCCLSEPHTPLNLKPAGTAASSITRGVEPWAGHADAHAAGGPPPCLCERRRHTAGGTGPATIRSTALASGCSDVVTKPLTIVQMRSLLDNALPSWRMLVSPLHISAPCLSTSAPLRTGPSGWDRMLAMPHFAAGAGRLTSMTTRVSANPELGPFFEEQASGECCLEAPSTLSYNDEENDACELSLDALLAGS